MRWRKQEWVAYRNDLMLNQNDNTGGGVGQSAASRQDPSASCGHFWFLTERVTRKTAVRQSCRTAVTEYGKL